jgi:ATP-dependent DNA helicase DinG
MKRRDEFLDLVFTSNGLLGRFLEDYEERVEQKKMSQQIFDAYSEDQIALIEAGTGIGKSVAYLVPAIIWALKHKEKTVISTHTIALQEQLLQKDIPFLLHIMDADLKAVLVKGMSNYLCLRKLKESKEQLLDEDSTSLEHIERWAEKTQEGSRSELPFAVSGNVWEKVRAEADTCNNVQCPHYKKCFFFKARRHVNEAQILIVNHHLLLTDLNVRMKEKGGEKSVLPEYKRLIIDEAHHLEEVALDSFAKRVDCLGLIHLLSRLYSDVHPERSRLHLLHQILSRNLRLVSLSQRLSIQLPAEKRNLQTQIETAFEQLKNIRSQFAASQEKWRLTNEVLKNPQWEQECKITFQALAKQMVGFSSQLGTTYQEIAEIDDAALQEKIASSLLEIKAVAERLEEAAKVFEHFFSEDAADLRVRWVESGNFKQAKNLALFDAHLDISSYLHDGLFDQMKTVSLCSATLTTRKEFTFIKDQLGIAKSGPERAISESIYDSPFDYKKNALLLVPTDLPLPSDPGFTAAAAQVVMKAVEASKGNAFVLFTSYEMLRTCYDLCAPHLKSKGYHLLKHGDQSRQILLDTFKAHEGSVLFGTDSFWEGIDVAGDALRCVILAKLPFKVPNDPLTEAYSELLTKKGKDPFLDYSIPQAVMKFKQGFGRLIRKSTDRGCIVCLDKRLATKGYGKIFIESLPQCRQVFDVQGRAIDEMKRFYTPFKK